MINIIAISNELTGTLAYTPPLLPPQARHNQTYS